ncbi:cupin domain-containing protein [Leptolyngbya sp. CCY15150]|uniref:cupin domain-containing protein n=1 Tax=Leptolyngbya sp. CCY15150 TaxID=2767772 RepID=UPI0019514DE4|nr:cupin domain-containing protein [Leptolyngbya sp. CCY15150]
MPTPLVLTDLFHLAETGDRLPWQPFRPGVEIYPLYSDPESSASAALLRYAPGATVPEHIHTGFEHIVVLSGSQGDRHGTYPAGTLVINSPDTQHSVASEDGCIVLVIWQRPVKILVDEP